MAVWWIVWCYFGLAMMPMSGGQRRALVQYHTPSTAKPSTPYSTLYPKLVTEGISKEENILKPVSSTASPFQRHQNRVITIASTRSPVRSSVQGSPKMKESVHRNTINNTRRVVFPNNNRRALNSPPKDARTTTKVPQTTVSASSLKPTDAPPKDEKITTSTESSNNSMNISKDDTWTTIIKEMGGLPVDVSKYGINKTMGDTAVDVSKYGLASDRDAPVVFDSEEKKNSTDSVDGGGPDHNRGNADKQNHHYPHKDGCHQKFPDLPRRDDDDRYGDYDDDYRYPYRRDRYRPYEGRYGGGYYDDGYIPRDDDRYRRRGYGDRYRPRDRWRDEDRYRRRYWDRPREDDRPRNVYKDRVPDDDSYDRRYPYPMYYGEEKHRNRGEEDAPPSKVPSENSTHVHKDEIQSSRNADVDVSKFGLASDKESPVVFGSDNKTVVSKEGDKGDTGSHHDADGHQHDNGEGSRGRRPEYPRRRGDDDRYSDDDDDDDEYRYERRPYSRYRPYDDRYGGRGGDRYPSDDDDRYRTRDHGDRYRPSDYDDRYRPRDYEDRWRDDERYKYDYRDRYRDEERYRPRYGDRRDRYRPRDGYRDRYPDDYSYERRPYNPRHHGRDGYRTRDDEDRYRGEAADKISPTRVRDDTHSTHHEPDGPRHSQDDSKKEHQTGMPGDDKHKDGVGLERRSYGSDGKSGSRYGGDKTDTRRDSSDDEYPRRSGSADDEEYPRRSTDVEYPRRRIKDDEDYRRNRPRGSHDTPKDETKHDENKDSNSEEAPSSDSASPLNGDRPLSAKDIIEAAQRQPDSNGQSPAVSVPYPSFDPRGSNLTSTDVVRPSERRGITIHSRRKRWVIL